MLILKQFFILRSSTVTVIFNTALSFHPPIALRMTIGIKNVLTEHCLKPWIKKAVLKDRRNIKLLFSKTKCEDFQ